MNRRHGFTLVELLVVIAVIALLIGILLPALARTRTTSQQMLNANNLRTMLQGMVVFSFGNDSVYPGLRSVTGEYDQDTLPNSEVPQIDRLNWFRGDNIPSRYLVMLGNEVIEPQTIISPVELDYIPNARNAVRVDYDPSFGQPGAPDSYSATDIFWSYAMLQLSVDQNSSGTGSKEMLPKVIREWKATGNARAPIASDRIMNFQGLPSNEFLPFPEKHDSLWTGPQNEGGWVGAVVYNDGHTDFIRQTSVITNTQFGSAEENQNDSLFSYDSGFDFRTRSDAVFVAHYATTPVIR